MNTQQPYLRRAELFIGPFSEWKGGNQEKNALRIFADGSREGLRMSFQVHKHAVSTSSPTVISVYGLSEKTRQALQQKELQIKMKVGWYNTDMVDLFSGTLLNAYTHRQGADLITDITTLAGWGSISRSLVSLTFTGGTRLSNILLTLAKKLEGITIDPKLIKVTDKAIGSQGWSFVGMTSSALDRLARVFGFSWWINDGVFYAKDDDSVFTGGRVVISHKDGSLLRAEPILASPFQQQTGTTITAVLNPAILPGGIVRLESGINTKLNQDYTVHSLSHSGDTHGRQWHSVIQSYVQV